jgi:hypothetical protein
MKTFRWPARLAIAASAATVALASAGARAQATVAPLADASAASAAALVNALLAPTSGLSVVAGSAVYVGSASASGTFTNGGTSPSGLGIDRGVVLTTGDARFIGSSADFPFDNANKSGTFTSGVLNALTPNASGGSALFAPITAEATTNASILSFQFIPTAGTLTLSFVFGSEDWNDLVNSGFPTDVFGIVVNGVNRAVVPGTTTPISASSVNCGGPTSGAAPGAGPNCGLYRDNPSFSDLVATELDGLTTLISLRIPVNVGVVNAMWIGIADTLDASGDSALMLQAGSVAAIPEPETVGLMAAGLAALGVVARRRRGRAAA